MRPRGMRDTRAVRRIVVLVLLLAACDGKATQPTWIVDARTGPPDTYEHCPRTRLSVCNPLTQAGCGAGEKCTWQIDALAPQYVGHVACAPMGAADEGEPCQFGPPGCDGYDNCKGGLVCSNYRGGTGTCRRICDQQGGNPTCQPSDACVTRSGLFSMGDTSPAAGGICEAQCVPLADNDFDGPGSALERSGSGCGSVDRGCYGYPSFGAPPGTAWTCDRDRHYGAPLFHRSACTVASGCADPGPTIYVNSCSQGYIPLLRESSMVSTAICVALCKPKNCYAGNCGANDEDRLGEAPHRCNSSDRAGTFSSTEHCMFSWRWEINEYYGEFLRSATSDTLGFCIDHAKYRYDSNGDGQVDANDDAWPACESLPLTGPLNAAMFGCVDTATAGTLPTGYLPF